VIGVSGGGGDALELHGEHSTFSALVGKVFGKRVCPGISTTASPVYSVFS